MEEEKKEILEEENKNQKVKSVSDFINRISEIRKERKEKLANQQDNSVLYFRGQSDVDWEIKPSIARNNKLLTNESYLLRETLSRCSSSFQDLINDFDKLTKLQHYGLPTRLLDVTTNPLVALYFACMDSKNNKECPLKKDEHCFIKEDNYCSLKNVDGVVYYGIAHCNYATDIEVQFLSYLAFYSEEMIMNNEYKKLLQNKISSFFEIINQDNSIMLFELIKKALLVQPNYNNERINRQSGMFLLPSLFKIEEKKEDFFLQR